MLAEVRGVDGMWVEARPVLSIRRRMLVVLNHGGDHGEKEKLTYLSKNCLGGPVAVIGCGKETGVKDKAQAPA